MQPIWETPDVRPHLSLVDVRKSFGEVRAVDGISLDIFAGEFFALLGPSGCGKTTVLRMLAGFETPDSGAILLDGENLSKVPPYERPVNMMFQSYALFPHMSVEKNISFGLHMEGMPRALIRERVDEMLALTRLEGFARRKPSQLSGGQRQRVALARALAKKPKLLLLDEPLGALDRKLREATQFELMNIQEELGLTFVIVTHDQEEAMTVSSRLAVMRDGRIAQLGPPREIYENPRSRYVAEFIGDVNLFSGHVVDNSMGKIEGADAVFWMNRPSTVAGDIELAIRPEKIEISPRAGAEPKPNQATGRIEDIAYLGDMSVYLIRSDAGNLVKVARANRLRQADADLTWDDQVILSWHSDAIVELHAEA